MAAKNLNFMIFIASDSSNYTSIKTSVIRRIREAKSLLGSCSRFAVAVILIELASGFKKKRKKMPAGEGGENA